MELSQHELDRLLQERCTAPIAQLKGQLDTILRVLNGDPTGDPPGMRRRLRELEQQVEKLEQQVDKWRNVAFGFGVALTFTGIGSIGSLILQLVRGY